MDWRFRRKLVRRLNNRKRMVFEFLIVLIFFLLIPVKTAMAVCPVCTVAIGAGVGLSRWLGIDDTISGLWVGGLLISSSLWFSNWLRQKNINLKYQDLLSIIFFTVVGLLPLYFTNIFGHPYNIIWGMDKLLVGIVIGSLLFLLSLVIDKYLRSKNEGRVFVAFQKVILPVSLLLIGSMIFFVITRY